MNENLDIHNFKLKNIEQKYLIAWMYGHSMICLRRSEHYKIRSGTVAWDYQPLLIKVQLIKVQLI